MRLTILQTRLIGDEQEDYTVQQLAYPFLHTWWRRSRMDSFRLYDFILSFPTRFMLPMC